MSILGTIYKKQGNLKLAEEKLIIAIDIVKKCFGSEHPCFVKYYSNFGKIYLE